MALGTAVLLSSCNMNPKEVRSYITTDNYANPRLEYYVYLPAAVRQERGRPHDVLVCVPGLGAAGDAFVDDKMRALADEENLVILAPTFLWDAKNYDAQKSYQFPSAWSGAAFLRVLDKVKADEGLALGKLYLFGLSAGAQFALRFSFLHPELCAACVAFSSGGWIESLAKNDVKYFIGLGMMDDATHHITAQHFQEIAAAAGLDVTWKEYNGGHLYSADQEEEALEFVKRVHGKMTGSR